MHRFCIGPIAASLLLIAPNLFAQGVPAFSQVIVFGDSLSDDGNIKHVVQDKFFISFPSQVFNYSDGRFTNSSGTFPRSDLYAGTWHEQLASTFLGLPAATNSLDGGTNYAFGGATTIAGASERTVISNPEPFFGGDLTITIDNLGKQVDDYLASHSVDPAALYIVWGGGNDLFDNQSADNITATAVRVAGLVEQLAWAGAFYILVPNVPPLGLVPNYKDDLTKAASLNAASAEYRLEFNTQLDAAVQYAGGRVDHHLPLSLRYFRTLLPTGGQSRGRGFHQRQRQRSGSVGGSG